MSAYRAKNEKSVSAFSASLAAREASGQIRLECLRKNVRTLRSIRAEDVEQILVKDQLQIREMMLNESGAVLESLSS